MVIDVHVHLAGTGSHSGCFISPRLRRSPAYLLMLATTGQIFGEVNDASIRQHLVGVLNGSALVDRAVFLAMDQVHDAQGRAHPELTNLHTPNDWVAELAAREEKVLFGASVHPDRADALDEIDRVLEQGAVLMKWIPSSQDINPSRKRYVPFYEKLARAGLPLLCHVGAEHAIPAPEPENQFRPFDDPNRLVTALEAGVKVIAAHCCTPVFSWDTDYLEDFLELIGRSEAEGWALYGDVSALAGPFPHRTGLLKRIVGEIPPQRLLLGSDYPIPVSPLWPGAAGEMDLAEWADAMLTQNPLDRNVKVMRSLGFGPDLLTNAERVLRLLG
jgi:predicted TIM-barrel fold metal-dependent hydrolase